MNGLHRRAEMRDTRGFDDGGPHADPELERVDDVNWGRREIVPRGGGMGDHLAELAGDVNGDNRGRPLRECRLIGLVKIGGRSWLRIGSRSRAWQARIELRGGDIYAVAKDVAIHDYPVGNHDDPNRTRVALENVRCAVGDDTNARVRLALRRFGR